MVTGLIEKIIAEPVERQDQATDVIPDRQKHLKLLSFFPNYRKRLF